MPEGTCPSCGGHFSPHHGVQGAPEDGQRELFCSEDCRDRGEQVRSRWHRETPTRGTDQVNWGGKTISAALAWDILDSLDDPFAE
jgi:hypothetical protein